MANCWLRSHWAEWFQLSTCCRLPVRIVEVAKFNNTSIFSLDREHFEIYICPAWKSRTCGHRQWSAVLVTNFHCICSWIHIQNKQSNIPAIKGAERAVKTTKALLKKSEDQYETFLVYRSTPWSNGFSPAELLMGQKLRSIVPVRLYRDRRIQSGHMSNMSRTESVKIISVKRKH